MSPSYLQPPISLMLRLPETGNGKRRRGYPCRTHLSAPLTEERKNTSTEVPRGRTHLAVCAEACLQARQESGALLPCASSLVPAPARWSCHARVGSSACSVSLERNVGATLGTSLKMQLMVMDEPVSFHLPPGGHVWFQPLLGYSYLCFFSGGGGMG